MTLRRPRIAPAIPALLVTAILLSFLALTPNVIYTANPRQNKPPHVFLGEVTVNGQPVRQGTEIAALIDGIPVATAQVDGQGNHNIVVPDQNDGSAIAFTISKQTAKQTGPFAVGGVTQLDLSLSAAPAPTNTPRIGFTCSVPIAPNQEVAPTAGMTDGVLMFAPLLGLAGIIRFRFSSPISVSPARAGIDPSRTLDLPPYRDLTPAVDTPSAPKTLPPAPKPTQSKAADPPKVSRQSARTAAYPAPAQVSAHSAKSHSRLARQNRTPDTRPSAAAPIIPLHPPGPGQRQPCLTPPAQQEKPRERLGRLRHISGGLGRSAGGVIRD